MRIPLFKPALLLAFCLLVSGCGIITCQVCADKNQPAASGYFESSSEQQLYGNDPVIISVTGFGALDTGANNKPQQILMAMRASEVDAYRALAERVKGLQVSGSTKVVDFVTEYDHLRALVDSYIKNAKILSQGLTSEGYYETTLSLTLNNHFFRIFSQPVREVTANHSVNHSANVQIKHGFALPPSSTLSTTDSHYDIGLLPVSK